MDNKGWAHQDNLLCALMIIYAFYRRTVMGRVGADSKMNGLDLSVPWGRGTPEPWPLSD